MHGPLDAQALRAEFDLPDDVTYLNSAYMGPLPAATVEAGVRGLSAKARPFEIGPNDFFAPLERLRGSFACLVGGDADGVAIVPSVSYGMAIAKRQLSLAAGDRILLLDEQFPSAVYAWRELARESGAEIQTCPRGPDGGFDDSLLAAIDEDTKAVVVPHVHWTDGTKIDLHRVSTKARKVGAALVVDGSQSIGALPFDGRAIAPDFVMCVCYKWLLGPYALSFLFVNERFRDGRPIEHNWIARKGSEDFARLVDYRDELQSGARRFDVGEVSNFALVPAAMSSLEWIQELGVERIADHGARLADSVCERAEALGLSVTPKALRSPHLVGIRLGDRDAAEVARRLADEKIFVSVRSDCIRVSFHFYNTQQDADRLCEVLKRIA